MSPLASSAMSWIVDVAPAPSDAQRVLRRVPAAQSATYVDRVAWKWFACVMVDRPSSFATGSATDSFTHVKLGFDYRIEHPGWRI